jgi:ferredoxin
MNKDNSIKFLPANIVVNFHNEASVLEVALKNKVAIDNSCGGSGSCGTCRVKIIAPLAALGPRTEVEQAMAEDRNFADDERLSCQTSPVPGLIVEIPD